MTERPFRPTPHLPKVQLRAWYSGDPVAPPPYAAAAPVRAALRVCAVASSRRRLCLRAAAATTARHYSIVRDNSQPTAHPRASGPSPGSVQCAISVPPCRRSLRAHYQYRRTLRNTYDNSLARHIVDGMLLPVPCIMFCGGARSLSATYQSIIQRSARSSDGGSDLPSFGELPVRRPAIAAYDPVTLPRY